MPSPSRGGGPAAMPKYQRIAAALRGDLDRAAHTPGGKLPSERSLAVRYQVNRQTIRAALQQLREDGLIVTGRRGTRPAAEPGSPTGSGSPAESGSPPKSVSAAAHPSAGRPADIRTPAPGAVSVTAAAFTQSWLTLVTVPPSLAGLLGMGGGARTLVHHQRDHGAAGETLRHAATYFSPAVTAATPELAHYRDRMADVRDEDLEPLHRWLDRVQAEGRVAETITMTRTTHPPASSPVCGLSVRRTLHDTDGRLLAVTDLSFPTWDRLTFHRDRRDHAATGFRVT